MFPFAPRVRAGTLMTLLSLIVLFLWSVTLLRTIVNLLFVPRLARHTEPRHLLISVIVPARDEERSIERTVRALLMQTHRRLELIVVNDRSVDSTGAILDRLATDDPRLIVIHGEEPPEGWLGKPWALHQGSRRASGELLLFVDADVHYGPEALASASDALIRADVSMVSLLPHFELRGFWEHVIIPNLAVMAFSVVPLWIANRTRIPWLAVGGGPGNLVTRAAYKAAGGHESLRDAVIDDVALGRLLRRRGYRTVAIRADAHISVRMYHGLREIIRGFSKNSFAIFDYRFDVLVTAVVASGLMNVAPYLLALAGEPYAAAAILVIILSRLILFIALGYGVLNALFAHPLMMLAWFYILMRAVWFTGIRRQVRWRGRTYDARKTRFGAD